MKQVLAVLALTLALAACGTTSTTCPGGYSVAGWCNVPAGANNGNGQHVGK